MVVPTRSSTLIACLGIAACTRAGTGIGGGAGARDIDDVSGAEMGFESREADRAEDQSQMGIRVREDGEVLVGGTEEGEVVERAKPEEEVEALDFSFLEEEDPALIAPPPGDLPPNGLLPRELPPSESPPSEPPLSD